MRKFFWCLWYHLGLYEKSDDLTETIKRIVTLIETCPEVEVKVSYFNINVKTKSQSFELWNANKYYAWLQCGTINGRAYSYLRPSTEAKYLLRKCLLKRGLNLNPPSPIRKLNIPEIKC